MENTRYTYLLQLHNVYATPTQIHTIQTHKLSNLHATLYIQ